MARRARSTWALIIVTGFEGIRAGAGTFRALLDLPARHEIGALAFADLSRATDLSTTGVVFYAIYGIGGAALTGAAWALSVRDGASVFVRRACAASFACSLLVLAMTAVAAPLMWRVGGSPPDAAAVGALLDSFAGWTVARIICADLSFVAVLSALGSTALARSSDAGER